MLERYTTERLAPVQKIRRWCDFGSSTLSRLAVRPYEPAGFRAQMVRATLGEIGITHMVSSAAVAHSAGGCVGDWAGSAEGALAVTYYKAGHPRLTQAGRTLQLGPGDIVIRDLRHRWEQDSREQFALMTLKVPVHCLERSSRDLDAWVMRPLHAGDPRAHLLASLIENLGRIAFESGDGPKTDAVEQLLRSAVEIAFGESGPAGSCGGLPPPVRACVEANLLDPALSVAGLARELNLSIRTVQRQFHQAGLSPKAYILARRLEQAAAHLRDAAGLDRMRITQLALRVGFNDPGYFSRAFHDRFGMTPTQYQRQYRYPV